MAEGSLALTNAIVWGNVIRGDASDLNVAPAATASAGTSDLGGVSGTVTDLGGNISADPLCVGRDDDHLTAASPAVDTGACLGAPATDIDGDTRPTRRLRHGRRRAGALSVRL